MLVEGLAALIPSNPAVGAVLGIPRLDKTSGVFPNTAPDEVLMPYIAFMQVSRSTIMSYQGVNRLQQARFRFSCYGPTYRTAKILAESLKLLLDGYTGLLADGTNLENTIPDTEVDTSESVFKATLYATHVDYTFVFVDTGSAVPGPVPVPSPGPVVFTAHAGQMKFTLPSTPLGLLMFYWNGQLLNNPAGYTVAGPVITTVQPASAGDIFEAYYL